MRTIGSIFLLPLLSVFGFGFFLAITITLTGNLNHTRDQLAGVQTEMQALQARYQSLAEEKNRLAEQVLGLTGENDSLKISIQALEAERLELKSQIEALQKELALIGKADSILAWLSSLSFRHIVAMIGLPIIPISAYIRTHKKTTYPPCAALKGRPGEEQSLLLAALTREEFHAITQIRKHRRSSRSLTTHERLVK